MRSVSLKEDEPVKFFLQLDDHAVHLNIQHADESAFSEARVALRESHQKVKTMNRVKINPNSKLNYDAVDNMMLVALDAMVDAIKMKNMYQNMLVSLEQKMLDFEKEL